MNSWNPEERLTHHIRVSFEQALASLTGATFAIANIDSAEAPKDEPAEPIVWQQSFSLVEGPALWILAGRDLWEPTARLTLESAGVDPVTEDDCRSTWHELLSQAAAGMAAGVTADILREVTSGKGEGIGEEPADVEWRHFSVTVGDKTGYFKAAWGKALAGVYDRRTGSATPASRETSLSRTFDLLLEVALPVTVSFGKASLQIREVLKLSTGSIVELDRFASDPVDVMVNGCVIARGEVVVLDGNYGVRISQIASREDRLRTGMSETARLGTPGVAA